ncbi:MAG: hypothetical protein JOY77_14350, partial [Alphaproteobacteria bacterium]|nr:hypothetical protein [Alphaproteobacteria bacterium]
MKTTIAASALMLGLAAPASAAETPSNSAVLSGGPSYDWNATATLCSFTNMGTQSITPL